MLIESHIMVGITTVTLSDLEWPFHASRAISAVAELLILEYVFSNDNIHNETPKYDSSSSLVLEKKISKKVTFYYLVQCDRSSQRRYTDRPL